MISKPLWYCLKWLGLIPDPIASKMLDPALPENWIWDQSINPLEAKPVGLVKQQAASFKLDNGSRI